MSLEEEKNCKDELQVRAECDEFSHIPPFMCIHSFYDLFLFEKPKKKCRMKKRR